MENSPNGMDDQTLLYLACLIFGVLALAKVNSWYLLWDKVPTHRFGFVLFCLLLGVIATCVICRKSKVVTASYLQKKSILGPGKDAVYCGRTLDKVPVYVKTRQRVMHTQVVGTTNAGKTESVILPWAIQDMSQGRGLLLIDGKADRDLLEKLWSYAIKAGRAEDFRLFSLGTMSQSQTFNPLIGGTAEEITERVFSAFTFENPFYRGLQYEVLAQTLRIFEAAKEVPTFLKLHQGISKPALLEPLCERFNDQSLNNWLMQFRSLSGMERDQRTSGLTSQISHFAFGKSAPLFNSTEPSILIDDALATGKIIYFQLPVLLSPFLGAATGKLVLQSLQSAIANRHRGSSQGKPFFSVYLDDFSEYLYPGFVSVLNKSRSANVGIVFAHQALGDIQTLGDPVANAILTNSNLKIFMRGNDPDSAEHFSKIIGTKATVKFTERQVKSVFKNQSTGDLSAREVEEFIVHPNCFKQDLGVGEAFMIIPHEKGSKTVRIKFDRYPDILREPRPEICNSPAVGFALEEEQKRVQSESPAEVVKLQIKESECSNGKNISKKSA